MRHAIDRRSDGRRHQRTRDFGDSDEDDYGGYGYGGGGYGYGDSDEDGGYDALGAPRGVFW